jgi:hypothetical protein
VVAGDNPNDPPCAVLKAWDAVTGEAKWAAKASPPSSVLLDYSPDGASVLIGAFEKGQGSVMAYGATTGQLQRTVSLPAEPKWVDFRSQSIGTITATEIILCDLTTGKERLRLSGHDGVHHHAISPDGLRLAISRSSSGRRQEMSEVSLWSLQSGSRLLTIRRPGLIGELCFTADSRRLMATYTGEPGDKPIQVWDATPVANP